MADNVGITPGTGATAAADDIDGALHQRVKITVGSDGVSRGDVDVANPMPVRQDDLGSIEQAAEQLNTALVNTGNDEPLQLVGLHPSFPLPIDTATPMPIAGVGPTGEQRQIGVDANGGVKRADTFGPIALDITNGAAQTRDYDPIIDTTGYNSISVHIVSNPGSIFSLLQSNDKSFWTIVDGFDLNAAAWQLSSAFNTPTTVLAYPVVGRYIRFRLAGSPGGRLRAFVYLRAAPFSFTPRVPSVNLFQVNSATPATAGSGVLAIGGPAAPGSAHSTTSPVQISGSDGTNVRRILTDTSGGVVLGTNGVTNGASVSTLISAATNNLTQLKGSLGRLHMIRCQNTVASVRYLKLFNAPSASVTMGTTNATLNFVIPASGELQINSEVGLNMGGTGISYALTGGSALNDNTAIAAGDLICNFMYV